MGTTRKTINVSKEFHKRIVSYKIKNDLYSNEDVLLNWEKGAKKCK
jgi:hypothetical protein